MWYSPVIHITGDPEEFDINVAPLADFPVDLYILMDLTASQQDALRSVTEAINDIGRYYYILSLPYVLWTPQWHGHQPVLLIQIIHGPRNLDTLGTKDTLVDILVPMVPAHWCHYSCHYSAATGKLEWWCQGRVWFLLGQESCPLQPCQERPVSDNINTLQCVCVNIVVSLQRNQPVCRDRDWCRSVWCYLWLQTSAESHWWY